jgi:uncharacterized RDD family membrane protein YckC
MLGQDGSAKCAECGGTFAVDDMIRHGAAFVCAKCKPVFLQKLAEGADVSARNLRYAGFWLRFLASILDGIILFIVSLGIQLIILGATLSQAVGLQQRPTALGFLELLAQLFGILLAIAYETFFIGRYGATFGKMAAKIHVVTADGGRVTYLRAFARYFAKIVSAFTLLIGYIMAAFDIQHRALHDRMCDTRVVMD